MSVWKKIFLFSFIMLYAVLFTGAQTSWESVKNNGVNDLITVFFTSGERGYIAGDKGFFTYTTDGGKSWQKQVFNTDQDINEIYFRNDDNGYVVEGTQLTLIGRYRNAGDIENAVFHLKGKTGKQIKTFNYSNLDFPMRAEKNDFLPRLWATRRVGWLMEQIRSNGEQKELRDEVVDLGTRYGIVTPYTSYLATDGSEREIRAEQSNLQNDVISRRISELPLNGRTASRKLSRTLESAAPTGKSAVEASKDVKKKQDSTTIISESDEAVKTGTIRKIGAKTFYLENGVWIDSEFKEEAKVREIKIAFASSEFFDLIAEEPALAQYFALGEQVVVVWKNSVYRITK